MSETAVAKPGTRLQNFLDRAGLRGFPWKTAVILYTISWGWLFIVRDSYWSDDWDEFKFRDLTGYDYGVHGFAPWKTLNILMFDNYGPAFMRAAVFVFFFLSSLLVYKVLDAVRFIDLWQRVAISLLFLILPFNTSRVALYTFYYSISYCLFFAAWYVLVTLRSRRSQYLACGLFLLSFQMFTMLVFFLLPVSHLFLLEGRGKIGDALVWLRKNFVLISLPVVYWVSRSLFWSASQEYHQLTDNKIIGFLKFLLLVAVFLIVLSLLYRWSKHRYKKPILLLIVGFCVMFVGYAPYIFYGLVGYGFDVPKLYLITMLGRSDWFSRHQILQPLGFSMALIGLFGLLPSFMKRFRNQIVAAVLAVSVVFNVAFGFEYVVDQEKQTAVITELRASQDKITDAEIQIVDQTRFLNARQRAYRERDWLGLFALAKGIESAKRLSLVVGNCSENPDSRLVLIEGPETHWQALKNWVSDSDMGFKVTVDDKPGACKPEMVLSRRSSGAIPILFYFTGPKG